MLKIITSIVVFIGTFALTFIASLQTLISLRVLRVWREIRNKKGLLLLLIIIALAAAIAAGVATFSGLEQISPSSPTPTNTPTPSNTPSPSSTPFIEELHIFSEGSRPNLFLVKGSNFGNYDIGSELIVYGFLLGEEIPVGLLKVVGINPNSLTVQVILKHEEFEIVSNLRVDDHVEHLSKSELVPAYDGADGYILENGQVRLRTGVDIVPESRIQALRPGEIDDVILDFIPFAELKIDNIGVEALILEVDVVNGDWDQLPSGTLIRILPPIPTLTPSPTIEQIEEGNYLVLVSKLTPLEQEQPSVTETIVDNLRESLEHGLPLSKVSVRFLDRAVTSEDEARSISSEFAATFIIWGQYDNELVSVDLQLGTIDSFHYLSIAPELLEETGNIRIQLTDIRSQSIAPYILSYLALLMIADGDGYNGANTMVFLDSLFRNLSEVNQEVAPPLSQNISFHVHRALHTYLYDPLQARDELNKAIELDAVTGNPLLYIMRNVIFQRLGLWDDALIDVETATRLGPEEWSAPLFALNARAFYFEKDLELSLNYLSKLVELRPTDSYPLTFRGAIYYIQGDMESAQKDLEAAIELEPVSNWPFALSTIIALRNFQLSEALTLVNNIIALPDPAYTLSVNDVFYGENLPNDVFRPMTKSFGDLLLGRFQFAVDDSVEAIQKSEYANLNSISYLIQGIAYCNLQEYSLAEQAYTQAIELDPAFPIILFLRAEARQLMGNSEGAEQDIQLAMGNTKVQTALGNPVNSMILDNFSCSRLFKPNN